MHQVREGKVFLDPRIPRIKTKHLVPSLPLPTNRPHLARFQFFSKPLKPFELTTLEASKEPERIRSSPHHRQQRMKQNW